MPRGTEEPVEAASGPSEERPDGKVAALERLTRAVAHDLNNRLMTVTGYSEYLLARLPAGDPSRADVEEIRKAGEEASLLVRRLQEACRGRQGGSVPARASSETGSTPPAPAGPLRVLLVEDSDVVRAMIRTILEADGIIVHEASDGEEAQAVFSRLADPVDLLVSDLMMPGIGGRELAGRLRAQRPGLKVLFISGFEDSRGETAEPMGPGEWFLQKPFLPPTLVRCVREIAIHAVPEEG